MTPETPFEVQSTSLAFSGGQDRSNWVRLRTLILLRWFAIVGQIAALTVAQRYFGMQLEIGLCYLAVGVSVIGNLFAIFVFPENKRLTESQNFLMVMFDLLQLGLLLYLTGGLNNPFALLLLGPVTISAAVLTTRSFVIIGVTAIFIATVLANFHLPLRSHTGFHLVIPDVFLFGYWLAIVIAVVFFGAYSRRVTHEMHSMSDALIATQIALAREQKLTDLGGVVAAAAHELGTPLATIKLTSSELAEELADQDDLREDAELIREQADRCRDILRDMGRAGKDDTHMKRAPLSAVIEEAAEPHEDRGIAINYTFAPRKSFVPTQPVVFRKPEIIHGLRNLVQNAVDFAHDQIWVDVSWSTTEILIRIADDGPGFPSQVIGRLGDPFMRRGRKSAQASEQRAGYEGMGLGLFIAKTLLERTSAELTFANGRSEDHEDSGRQEIGAVVQVRWPREAIDGQATETNAKTAENERIRA